MKIVNMTTNKGRSTRTHVHILHTCVYKGIIDDGWKILTKANVGNRNPRSSNRDRAIAAKDQNGKQTCMEELMTSGSMPGTKGTLQPEYSPHIPCI